MFIRREEHFLSLDEFRTRLITSVSQWRGDSYTDKEFGLNVLPAQFQLPRQSISGFSETFSSKRKYNCVYHVMGEHFLSGKSCSSDSFHWYKDT